MRYLKKQELVHRIHNGYITHDGRIGDKFYDIYKANGIDIENIQIQKFLECLDKIIDSVEQDASVNLMPREVRGNRLRDIRIEQGYSINGLARASGVSAMTISNIERGVRNPRIDTVQTLVNVLEISEEDLR